MSGPPIPPPGAAAPSSPSGAAGLVALPSEIVRLPQELAARLLTGPRTVFVTGTVTGQGADGSLNIRSQFGEISVRTGSAVPADRQVSLQIPPLSGKAATLTPPQLSSNPIPASLLLSKLATPQSAGETPASTIGSPAGARAAPLAGTPATVVASAPSAASPAPAPLANPAPGIARIQSATVPGPPPPGAAPPPTQTAAGPTAPAGASAPPAGVPAAPNSPTGPATGPATPPQAAVSTAGSPPATPSAAASPAGTPSVPPAPAAPPLGRLALTAQMLTQSNSQPAARTSTPTAPPPVQSPGVAPQPLPLPQSATPPAPMAPTTATAGAAVPPPGPAPSPAPAPAPGLPNAGAGVGTAAASTPPSLPTAAAEIGDDAIPLESMRRVPALREAVSVLNAADPALATQFARSVLPQANTQLAATLLFFLAATRSGDIRGWMGDRVTTTLDNSGRGDLMPKLSAELATPGRAVPDAPAGGEWRSQTVPLYQDGDIGGMAVHVRRTGDDGGQGGEEMAAGHRFLIDMDLSRMGPLQLDGLVHDTRFDLTIRSPAAFPEPMRQDMRTLFRDASNAVGLHGGLTFQAGGHDWETVAAARGG